MGFPGSVVKNLPAMQELQKMWIQALNWEDSLDKEMANRSSISAWKIPWTEKHCRLQSKGLQRVGHSWTQAPTLQKNIYHSWSKIRKVKVLVTQSCLTLCNPMDWSPPGFSPMEFSRQDYWSQLPYLSPGDLPNPGIKPVSPALQADSLPPVQPGKGKLKYIQRTRN